MSKKRSRDEEIQLNSDENFKKSFNYDKIFQEAFSVWTSSPQLNPIMSLQNERLCLEFVGRRNETRAIISHIQNILYGNDTRPLYICGTPGSGKSACIISLLSVLIPPDKKNLPEKVENSGALKSQETNRFDIACFPPIEKNIDFTQLDPLCLIRGEKDISTFYKNINNLFLPYYVFLNAVVDNKPTVSIFSIVALKLLTTFNNWLLKTNRKISKSLFPPSNSEPKEQLISLIEEISDLHYSLENLKFENLKKNLKFIIVIDEIDQVSSRNNQYQELVDLLQIPSLFVISIANSIEYFDLLSAISLKNQQTCPILTIQFTPYTSEQISQIIISKLNRLQFSLIEPRAIKFISTKVSKLPAEQSGDFRIVFDLIKNIIMYLENLKNPSCETPPINLNLIIKIWNEKISSSPKFNSLIDSLPLIQKAILVALINKKASEPIRTSVLKFETKKICKSIFASPVSPSEIEDSIKILQGTGIINVKIEKKRVFYSLKSYEECAKFLKNQIIFKDLIENKTF